MPDLKIGALSLAFMRSCPRTLLLDRNHGIDPQERERIARLQRTGLVRVKIREDLDFGAGHQAQVTLTDLGRAELAKREPK